MNHRVSRVKELIKRELGMILERNFTFSGSLVTIQEVDVTPDFKQCFIYVGILGKEHAAPNIVRKLNEGRHLICRELFKRVILKNSPSLTFKFDTSVERGVRVNQLIDNLPEFLPDEDPAVVEANPASAIDADSEEDPEVEDQDPADLDKKAEVKPYRKPRKRP